MKMKYVIFEQIRSLFDVPLFFPALIKHDDFTARYQGQTIISAGMIYFEGQDLRVVSGSTSLQINGNAERSKEDESIIVRYLDFEV